MKPHRSYKDRAEEAARRVTDSYARRWKRIKSDPATLALFEEAMRLSQHIPDSQIAADVFEHVAAIRGAQIIGRAEKNRPPTKHRGPHDPEGDDLLLFYYDRARNGELPGQTVRWSKPMLAQRLKGERWGTAQQIIGRLERLINKRNKSGAAK